MRLAFMGTPVFALPTLEAIHKSHHQLVMIWTKPERKRQRGQKTYPTPVALWAERHNIPLRQIVSFTKQAEDKKILKELNIDAALIVSFGVILPQNILAIPPLGCLNLHPSLLPRWRGAAPIERAIEAGDEKTGITIMLLGEGVDDGDMLAQKQIMIGQKNAGQLRQDLALLGADLMMEALERWEKGKITPIKQNHEKAVWAAKIQSREEEIDWTRPAKAILHQIRALAPKPGAWSLLWRNQQPIRIRLLDAHLSELDGKSGDMLDEKHAIIGCGEGALAITHIQREGKKPMAIDDFLRGFPLIKGRGLGYESLLFMGGI